jgi:MoaA/NifB/PqqE/SkfB family radical SAM enzyme
MRLDLHDNVAPELFRPVVDRKTQKRIFKRYVSDVVLELFDHCNRKCPYCPVSLVDRRSAVNHMAPDHLDKIARNLAEIGYDKSICLNLFNEPMADEPALFAGISLLKEACPNAQIWFNTNGDYLNRENLAQLVEMGLARLVVTLHVPESGTYDDMRQLTRVSQFSARTGVILNFKQFRSGRKIIATGRFKSLPIKLKSVNYTVNGENRGGLLEQIPVEAKRRAPCDRPFHDFTVAWNGDAYPCCQFFAGLAEHDPFIAGNVGAVESIFSLYASGLMASFRRDLFGWGAKKAPCDTCTEYDRPIDTADEAQRAALARSLFAEEQPPPIKGGRCGGCRPPQGALSQSMIVSDGSPCDPSET